MFDALSNYLCSKMCSNIFDDGTWVSL